MVKRLPAQRRILNGVALVGMESRRTVTLLVNQAARRVAATKLNTPAMARYIERRGFTVTTVLPASGEEATFEAHTAAARGDTLLFAAGGDGTLRDCAAGLSGSDTALAALPGGTVSVWCREAGIPRGFRDAVDTHLSGQVTAMDLGLADNAPFLLMASLGWDAAVTRSVPPALKRLVGDAAYVIRAATMAPWARTTAVRWRTGLAIDEHPLALMVISNTRLYGGRVRFAPEATAVDGCLDFVALCPVGLAGTARLGWKALRSRADGDRATVSGRVTELTVETAGVPVQLDGDYVGETPMAFRVAPLALRVSVPAGSLPPILRG